MMKLHEQIESIDWESFKRSIDSTKIIVRTFKGSSELRLIEHFFEKEDYALLETFKGSLIYLSKNLERSLSKDEYETLIEEATYQTHKMLRQTDVFSDGEMNSIAWHLFHIINMHEYLKSIFRLMIKHDKERITE